MEKQIPLYPGTNNDITATKFIRKIERQVQMKLGTPPIQFRPGPDPDGLDPNDPHETREWKNYQTKRTAILGLHLTGKAEQWFNTLITIDPNHFHNWEAAKTEFIQRFDNENAQGKVQCQLEHITRNPNETIIDWNARITDLVNYAFPHTAPEFREEQIRSYFKKGLSYEMKLEYNKIYLRNRNEPHINIVIQISITELAHTITHNFQINPSKNYIETHELYAYGNDNEEQEPRKSKRNLEKCTYCNKSGHNIEHCQQKRFEESYPPSMRGIVSQRQQTTRPRTPVPPPINPITPRVRHPSTSHVRQPSKPRFSGQTEFRRPPGGSKYINYWQGTPAPFNLNFSRGQSAPGTTNYPYRYPSRQEVSNWDEIYGQPNSSYQRIQRIYNPDNPIHPNWKSETTKNSSTSKKTNKTTTSNRGKYGRSIAQKKAQTTKQMSEAQESEESSNSQSDE